MARFPNCKICAVPGADLAFAATLRGDLSGSSSYSATLPFSLPAGVSWEGYVSMLLRFLRGGCSMGALSHICLGLHHMSMSLVKSKPADCSLHVSTEAEMW